MKYTHIIFTLFLVHCTLFLAKAQVAINTDNSNPDSSAILDIKSTNKGFLYPRMSNTERDAIPNPSIGLTIFNLDDKCTDIYDGNAWMKDCPLVETQDSIREAVWREQNCGLGNSYPTLMEFSIDDGYWYIGTFDENNDPLIDENIFLGYYPLSCSLIRIADFLGVPRSNAVSFSIGVKGYICTGIDENDNLKKDLWESDLYGGAGSWDDLADFGGTARTEAVGFDLNEKGYVGLGLDANGYTKDFWEYDPNTDTWTQKTDFAGTSRKGAVSFTIGGKAYVGTGLDSTGYTKDFWEYDPIIDTWTAMADFPGTARSEAVGFAMNGKGYIGLGLDANTYQSDFYEYDPTTNQWIEIKQFPLSLSFNDYPIIATEIEGKGYLVSNTIRFWELDVQSKPTYEPTSPSSGFTINSVINDIDQDTRVQVEANTDEDNIRFEVAANEAMRIKKNGNVGIGTSNPSSTLEVNGTIMADTLLGDGSNLINVPGDNLGNHTAATTLDLVNNNIINTDTITANYFIGDGSNLSNLPVATVLQDADNDTKIQVEESVDEDIIRFDVNGGERLQISSDQILISNPFGLYFPSAFGPDTSFVGALGNSISFGHPGVSEDYITYKNNTFFFKDSPGGGDVFEPNIETGGNIIATSFIGDGANLTNIPGDNLGTHMATQNIQLNNQWLSNDGDNEGIQIDSMGNIGIGESNPNVALDVSGDIEYTGTITDVSDRRLKENLLPISAVLTKLLQLQAYSYNMVDDAAKPREYGLLAQEVQKVFPEMVSTIDAEGEYLGLSYIQLIPILLEGMKEQQVMINQLTMENEELKAQVQTDNQEVKARLSQIEALLSQKETAETNTIHSEK